MRRKKRSGFLFIVGVIVIILVCLFLSFVWPRISATPTMWLNGDEVVTIPVGTAYTDEGANAEILREAVNDQIYEEGDVDTSTPGTYEVKYNVDGRWTTYSLTRTVDVVDTEAPDIELKGDEIEVVDKIDDYKDPGVTATDDCDGDLTDKLSSRMEQENEYTYEVTYDVEDKSGNKATATREVQIRDDVLPEIALNGDAAVTIDQNTPYEDPGVTASDNRDGDISDAVEVDGYVDPYRSGTYEITYTATDTSGNQASVTRTVEVASAPAVEDHAIYLTFDDGPSDDVTIEILDTLKANDIKATFFILNYTDDKLPILQRMLDEGHTIGIHGYSHDYEKIYATDEVFLSNIDTLRDKLKQDTGYDAFVMRFPGGSSNTVSRKYNTGIMSRLVQEVTAEGWMYMDWSISSGDAEGNNIPTETLISNVEGNLKPDSENVILMHDTSQKQTTAEALQTIITYGKDNGYSFYPVTQETIPVHHEVNN